MNLNNLSNEILEARLKRLVKTERKITHLVLQCIAEIDRRKLYLEKAYSSLFEFLVQSHGYSPSAAMRRIDGARLLQQIPEVAKKLKDGSVNLSQVALLQRADRELKREMGATIPVEIKRDLLAKIENQTQLKTEQMISRALNLDFSPKNKTTHHKDESVTLTVTLTREQMQILQHAQATLSHAVPEKNWASLVIYLAKKELSRRAPKSKSNSSINVDPNLPRLETSSKAISQMESTDNNSTAVYKQKKVIFVPPYLSKSGAATVINSPIRKVHRKPISQPLKKQLLSNNQHCTFRDHQTGKVCGSRHFLQVDHIHSVSRGGSNEPDNLQILCGQHNRYKFMREVKCRKFE